MEKNKSIKTNMIMSIILTSSNFVFPLITYTYVARALLPEGTGKVAFVQSVITYFTYIAMLGVAGYGRRECAKVRDNREQLSILVKELLSINLVATIIAYLLLVVSLVCIPKFSENKSIFFVMSATILLQTIGIEWFYQALEKYSYITIRSLIFKTVSIGLIFALVHDPSDCVIYAAIITFSTSASYVLNLFNSRKYISYNKYKPREIRKHLAPIMVFFFSAIIITVYGQLDTLMLGFMKTDYEVGIYNAALKIKIVVVSVSTAITGVLIPRMTVYYNSKSFDRFYELLTKSFRVTLVLMFPLSLFTLINSTDVLILIGGKEYIPAKSALIVMMICTFLLSLTNFFGNQILIPKGQEKRYSFSVFIGLLIDIFLNAFLIPAYGAVGAALATLVTESWNMVWMGLGCKIEIKETLLKIKMYKYIAPLVIVGIVDFVFAHYIEIPHLIIRLIINALIFLVLYYSILLLEKDPIMLEGIKTIKRVFKIESEKQNK